jgi:hypothetical protein
MIYRRNQDGTPQEIIPEARGKAAAITSYLAQGGGMTDKTGLQRGDKRTRGGQITRKGMVVPGSTVSPGERYTSGPMRGMTMEQATQKAEGMWASSPDALKEKYASRSESDLAPSEKKKYDEAKAKEESHAKTSSVTSTTPAPRLSPEQSRVNLYENQKRSRIRLYQGDAGLAEYDNSLKPRSRPQPMTLTTPSPLPGISREELSQAPAIPAGGLDSVGDGSSSANGYQPQTFTRPAPLGEHAKLVESYQHDANDPVASRPSRTPVSPPTTILGAGPGGGYDSNQVRATRVAADLAKPLASPADARRADDQRMMVQAPAPADARRADDQRMMAATQQLQSPVVASAPVNQVMPSAEAKPMMGPPISAMSAPTTVASPAPNINRLTGLPFGYSPGDSAQGLDQTKVAQSNQRMIAAMDQAVAKAPRAIPVLAPTLGDTRADNLNRTGRADGYQARSFRQDQDLESQQAQERADYSAKVAAQGIADRKMGLGMPSKPALTSATRPSFARRF